MLPYLRPTINSGLEIVQEVGRNLTSTPADKLQTLKLFHFVTSDAKLFHVELLYLLISSMDLYAYLEI